MNRQARRQEKRGRAARPAPKRSGAPPGRRLFPGRFLPPLGIGLVVVAVVGVIVIAVVQVGKGSTDLTAEAAQQEQDQNPNRPGQWIDPGGVYPDTGEHVEGNVPLC